MKAADATYEIRYMSLVAAGAISATFYSVFFFVLDF